VVRQVYEFFMDRAEDHIELTLQEIKEELKLPISSEGVGACEQLLERAGVIERLEAVENKAAVRINSDLPNLADLVPQQAKVKRRVLAAVEAVVGGQRRDWVYVHPRELMALTDMDGAALSRALRELDELDSFDYVPPFRGRAVHVCRRGQPFQSLAIDFETQERRKAAEYAKLERIIGYGHARNCRQGQILRYFGEKDVGRCGHCDNCNSSPTRSTTAREPQAVGAALLTPVKMVLSGVARANGRCGKQLLAQMLCGSNDKKVQRNRLNRLSTFGLLAHLKQTEVIQLIEALVATGHIAQVEIDRFRPVLELTPLGAAVMSGRSAMGLLPMSAALLERLCNMPAPASASPARAAEKASQSSSPPRDEARPECPPRDAGVAQTAPEASPQPSYYWTWRLLEAGFAPDECMAVRGLSRETVLDHALRAADEGWHVRVDWFLSDALVAQLEELIGDEPAPRIRPLLPQLPPATRYEDVQWFLKCRRSAATAEVE
jgi:ATP-dependent DNA helicase RecQ